MAKKTSKEKKRKSSGRTDKKANRLDPLMSSSSGDWETPQELFNLLNEIFEFDLDVCASEVNTKVPANYFDLSDDAFSKKWEGKCWMNPPYGKWIKKWVCKAAKDAVGDSIVVCLLPARVETSWFEIVWREAKLICFVRGRLKFEGAESCAPFPSAIAVFSEDVFPMQIAVRLTDIGFVVDRNNGIWMMEEEGEKLEAEGGR